MESKQKSQASSPARHHEGHPVTATAIAQSTSVEDDSHSAHSGSQDGSSPAVASVNSGHGSGSARTAYKQPQQPALPASPPFTRQSQSQQSQQSQQSAQSQTSQASFGPPLPSSAHWTTPSKQAGHTGAADVNAMTPIRAPDFGSVSVGDLRHSPPAVDKPQVTAPIHQTPLHPPQLPPPLPVAPTSSAPRNGSLALTSAQSSRSFESSPPGNTTVPGVFSHSGQGQAPLVPDLNATATDSSVLLGLEELERQQADSEKRRAEQAAREAQLKAGEDQPHKHDEIFPTGSGGGPSVFSGASAGSSLPPLPPAMGGAGGVKYMQHVRRRTSGDAAVPSQIHLLDEDEDTALSSDMTGEGKYGDGPKESKGWGGAPGGSNKDTMKRVTSIEKFGKYIRNRQQVSLRRLRSWSQDRGPSENPASSVASTQNATLSRTSHSPGEAGNSAEPQKPVKTGESTDIGVPFLEDEELKPLIYGYLHKLGRNGHWQRRFFETNGERLTYYKSMKRAKVLATLDLCKVGEIAIDRSDPEECTFTIQVSNRPYYLRAEDKARCNDWVIILNRAREARMNVGNIQLANPKLEDPHRSQAGSDDYAPCIVISALRPRTQAVNFDGGTGLPPDLLNAPDEEQPEIDVVLNEWDHPQQVTTVSPRPNLDPASAPSSGESMAKWEKHRSTMHRLSLRFLKWARSITKTEACRREKDVIVVPAHVVRSMVAQSAEELLPGIGNNLASTEGAIKPKQNPSVLPNLDEDKPSNVGFKEGDLALSTRSRADTSSPAFGMGSSQYV